MADITLYTHEGPGAGLTSGNVNRVKGAVALRIVTEGMEWQIPLTPRGGPVTRKPDKSTHPVNGKADLLLQIAEREVDLAKCKGAVALYAAPTETIYWIEAGQCSRTEQTATSGTARADIEGRCCQEYELPPQIG
jgi:hypothetical protein